MRLAARVELLDLETGESVYACVYPFEPTTSIAIDLRKAFEEATGRVFLSIARDLTSKP